MNQFAANPAQDFLDNEFPPVFRHLVPTALRKAYQTADLTIESQPALQTPGGRFQRGDLIAHAAEFEIERLITTRQLPFAATWEPFARPTGLHLVVWTERGRLTISQVEDWRKKPRIADFREDYGMRNMGYLFKEWNEEAAARSERKHLLLLHGYKDLNFCYITVPDAQANCHLACSPNLLMAPHVATNDHAKEEGPTDSPDPEALEHLTRIIRDNGDD